MFLSVQVWASLVFNVIGVLIGLAGLAYVSWLLVIDSPSDQLCGSWNLINTRITCFNRVWQLDVSLRDLGLRSDPVQSWFFTSLFQCLMQIAGGWMKYKPFLQNDKCCPVACFSRFCTDSVGSSWFCSSCRFVSASLSAFSLGKPSDAAATPHRSR